MKKRYWLRGGVAGLVVSAIYSLWAIISNWNNWGGPWDALAIYVLLIICIILFVIGILFGWIYGKIKNRNKV